MRGAWGVLSVGLMAVSVALRSGDAVAGKFKVLHSFCSSRRDGCFPAGALVMDQLGDFFGTAAKGGRQGDGVVFELVRQADGNLKFKSLFRFCDECGSGFGPRGSLIIDTRRNLYGITGIDGESGLVFKLSPTGDKWAETILYKFCSPNCTGGNGPVGGLTYAGQSSGLPYDGVSPLFGVTGGGGASDGGMVFELTNSGAAWAETVLYNFCSQGARKCRDGKSPNSALIMDSGGNLFGTALYGGNDIQAGTAFELSPSGNTWQYTLLYTFCSAGNCADGANPSGPLLFDQKNNLLGTTYAGATCRRNRSRCGTIFKIVPNGSQSQESVLHTFCQQRDCRDGAAPVGALVADPAGTLFGVTAVGGGHDLDQGGNGGGTVFELMDSGLTVLHKFCALANCADGEHPLAGVILDQAGEVYGTTGYGGEFAKKLYGGTIFQLKAR